MGDVDWAKRSYYGYYGGPDAFSSMGDVDWSKRSAVGAALRFGIDGDPALPKDKRSRGLYRSWLSRGNSPGIRQSMYYLYHFGVVKPDVNPSHILNFNTMSSVQCMET